MHKLTFLTPFNANLLDVNEALSLFAKQSPMVSFEPVVLDFIKLFSNTLLKENQYKQYPELVALGFWLRTSNLKTKLKEVGCDHLISNEDQNKYNALGCVVHFTPANVDTMFIYSWVASLLLGNINIIRVSSQDSQSKIMLLQLLTTLFELPTFEPIRQRNVFVTYDKTSNFTNELSALADARLIWGGDESVRLIKQSPCKFNCRDLSFADKYSLSIVNLDAITSTNNSYASLLWRDTQAYYQQACSSPRILLFIGEHCPSNLNSVKQVFDKINQLAKDDAENWKDDTRVNEHLVTIQSLSIQSSIGEHAVIQIDQISAAIVEPITQDTMSEHKGNGLYYVSFAESVEQALDRLVLSGDQIQQSIASKVQTISVFGFTLDDINDAASVKLGHAAFRVQDQGQALDFSFKWDGYNLLESLSS
jgi:hypothetical protein